MIYLHAVMGYLKENNANRRFKKNQKNIFFEIIMMLGILLCCSLFSPRKKTQSTVPIKTIFI